MITILSALLLGAAMPAIPNDTITLEQYLARVRGNHPVVRQARLGIDAARGELRTAVGAFDPTVSATWDRKTFGSVQYYDYMSATLSVPTPTGIDVKLGFDRTDGRYINPDRRTPSLGLFTAGISIPIGQRMITDERRTAIAVARAVRDGAVADLGSAVNRVLLQATRDYARWLEASRRAEIARLGVSLAEFRLNAVRQRVGNGEAAAIDTVEALVELRRRQVTLLESEQARFAARLAAEAALWDAGGLPDTLATGATPAATAPVAPESPGPMAAIADAIRANPDVRRTEARVASAEASRRLAAQGRLPLVAVEAAALGAGGPRTSTLTDASTDDAKLGASARSPLLYLRERGRADAATARAEQALAERDRTRREIDVLIRTASAELSTTNGALALQREVVTAARALLRGEQTRFEAGESTLFLVNTRERALLDEELRLAALEARLLVARGDVDAATGRWLPGTLAPGATAR